MWHSQFNLGVLLAVICSVRALSVTFMVLKKGGSYFNELVLSNFVVQFGFDFLFWQVCKVLVGFGIASVVSPGVMRRNLVGFFDQSV